MDPIRQEINVAFRYPVHFTTGVFNRANALLREVVASTASHAPAAILFVVDRGVHQAHPSVAANIESYCLAHRDALDLAGPVMIVAGGEQAKNDPKHLQDIQRAIHDAGLCRHSYVAAVGGGAVLDVVGYAAATAHRGVRLIRIPTTVLAQDDSAVGVKNGINAFGKKNYFGTFAPPFAVLNDFDFLTTLSDRDWRGGVTEAVKAALVRDAGFFDFLERTADRLVARDLGAMKHVVHRCAALHLAHIAEGGDPFEMGSSRPLDFGHWCAHKLEQVTRHRLGHGEAVAVGIALDTTYSYFSGFLAEQEWRRIIALLQALGLAVYVPELSRAIDAPDDPACVLRGLDEFREHLGGRLTIMLLRGIGNPFDVHDIDHAVMIRSVDALQEIEDRHESPIPAHRQASGR